jgi:hypothetical protein
MRGKAQSFYFRYKKHRYNSNGESCFSRQPATSTEHPHGNNRHAATERPLVLRLKGASLRLQSVRCAPNGEKWIFILTKYQNTEAACQFPGKGTDQSQYSSWANLVGCMASVAAQDSNEGRNLGEMIQRIGRFGVRETCGNV